MTKDQTITLPDGTVWELVPESLGSYAVQPNDRLVALRQQPEPDPFGEVDRIINERCHINDGPGEARYQRELARAIIKLCDGRYRRG